MPIFAIKMLAVGFAASMAFPGSIAHLTSTSVGQTSQSLILHSFSDGAPNAYIQTAALYATPSIQQNQSPLDRWIEKLIAFESNGKKNIKILDHNGEHSFGCLQFQKETFEEFGMKYQLIAINDDTEKLIYNCELQKEIAKAMIKENYSNWRHWYTSVMIKKLGLPPTENTLLYSPKKDVEDLKLAEAKK
mgnify:CR=1 FL=1